MAAAPSIKLHFNAKDLTGQRFTRLTVIAPVGVGKSGHVLWLCRCDCGNEKIAASQGLRRGNTKSCGCLQAECNPPRIVTHGRSKTALYSIWEAMVARCENKNFRQYASYGGRGIRVCDRWRRGNGIKSGFECFAEDMGERPSKKHSLDRIDNDGNYEPGNCRWATKEVQQNNMRSNVRIETNGKTLTMTQWARELGINPRSLIKRLRRGWPPELAVTTPPKHRPGRR